MVSCLRAVVTLFLTSVLLAENHNSWSQVPVITFEVITSKEGLPSNTVMSATRDKSGFMWFGTRLCPVRYDGNGFKSFTAYTTNFITGKNLILGASGFKSLNRTRARIKFNQTIIITADP